jgi:hypothetical protein
MRLAAFLVLSLLFMDRAEAAPFYVVSGKSVKLHFAYSVNPDCSSTGEITARVTQSPQHGRISVTRAQDFPRFPNENVRSICNRRRVPGIAIQYFSQRGFVGSDSVGIEIIYPKGAMQRGTFSVEVR